MRISLQSVGLFLQSVGFPFDIQGPGSSRNVLLHFLHNKAIEDGNQTCSGSIPWAGIIFWIDCERFAHKNLIEIG